MVNSCLLRRSAASVLVFPMHGETRRPFVILQSYSANFRIKPTHLDPNGQRLFFIWDRYAPDRAHVPSASRTYYLIASLNRIGCRYRYESIWIDKESIALDQVLKAFGSITPRFNGTCRTWKHRRSGSFATTSFSRSSMSRRLLHFSLLSRVACHFRCFNLNDSSDE